MTGNENGCSKRRNWSYLSAIPRYSSPSLESVAQRICDSTVSDGASGNIAVESGRFAWCEHVP